MKNIPVEEAEAIFPQCGLWRSIAHRREVVSTSDD
jgi:hypothetical protein